jgi:rod shape-determining protein MreC
VGARGTVRRLAYGICLVTALALVTAQGAPQVRDALSPLRARLLETFVVRAESRDPSMVSAWDRLTNRGEKDRRIAALEAQVRDLSRFEQAAIAMQQRMDIYESLLNLQGEPEPGSVTARAVREVDGPFAQTRLVNAGAAQGVVEGGIAINEKGLVGRVIDVGQRSSRILLVTDYNSRVPVVGEVSGVRALVFGERDGDGMLTDLPERPDFVEGERILTSGEGGLFPMGLPVGRAYRQGADWRVALAIHEGSPVFVRLIRPVIIPRPEDDPAPEAADASATPPAAPQATVAGGPR